MSIFSKITAVCLGLFIAISAHAETNAETLDKIPELIDPCLPDWIVAPLALPVAGSLTEVSANTLTQPDQHQVRLIGDARLSQPGLLLLSDELLFNRQTQQAYAFGQVEIHETATLLKGKQADFNQQQQTGQIETAQYQFKDSRAHGKAEHIHFDQTQQISELRAATYTSCPLDDQAWSLHFQHLQINNPKRRIYGKHTWMEFKGIPVFYTPYIDIPMDERASGLLFPYIGSHKTAAQSQSDPLSVVAVPYYFNIAPNYDATLTAIAIEQRGLVLDNEFRYLQPKHRGQFQISLLQDQLTQKEGLRYVDRSGNIQVEDPLSQRWRLGYNGSQNWGQGLNSNINWQEVSDPDFYNDVPLNFAAFESTRAGNDLRLDRQIRLNYRQGPLQAHIQHYGYLPLRNGESNYLEKSPEIGVNLRHNLGNLRGRIYLESTEFVRYNGFNDFFNDGYVAGQKVGTGLTNSNLHMGQRLIAQPNLTYRINRPYGHLQAQVQANFRQYHLENAPDEASTNNMVMQYALRGGLVFERDLFLFNRDYIQTLEPEVQLLYVPYVDQSHLRLFDSANNSLDFSNLFQLNRFSGFDRIGDTKQLSAAVTTRLLNEQGAPLADAAIGQIFYLADREVGLAGNQLQQDPRSDYFVRVSTHLNNFNFASTSQYDYQTYEMSQILNRLKWQAVDRVELLAVHQGLNLNNENNRAETLGAGLLLGLTSEWQLAGYVNYDLEEQTRREFMAGLRYDSCCWASELVYEETQMADGRYNYGIRYVIEFKGLSTVGSRLKDTIHQTLNF